MNVFMWLSWPLFWFVLTLYFKQHKNVLALAPHSASSTCNVVEVIFDTMLIRSSVSGFCQKTRTGSCSATMLSNSKCAVSKSWSEVNGKVFFLLLVVVDPDRKLEQHLFGMNSSYKQTTGNEDNEPSTGVHNLFYFKLGLGIKWVSDMKII